MEEKELAATMETIGYLEKAKRKESLPNGKAFVRIDFENEALNWHAKEVYMNSITYRRLTEKDRRNERNFMQYKL